MNPKVETKEMVTYPNGSKAMLIFRGEYPGKNATAEIASYYPSPAYFKHIKGKQLVIKRGQLYEKPKSVNSPRLGVHEKLINELLAPFFRLIVNRDIPMEQEAWVDIPVDYVDGQAPPEHPEQYLWKLKSNFSKLPYGQS